MGYPDSRSVRCFLEALFLRLESAEQKIEQAPKTYYVVVRRHRTLPQHKQAAHSLVAKV
jgi:hypothetical protein